MVFHRLKQFQLLFVIISLQFITLSYTHAQQLSSEQIKVAYLYNFLKHVNWPNEGQKSSFIIAIYQDPKFFQEVKKGLSGRVIKQKPIQIRQVSTMDRASSADLVFVSVTPEIDISILASDLRKTDTLLVTSNSVDKHNIMINLFLNEQTSSIDFEVNTSNIVYEGLSSSKELMLLGGTEIEVAELYRETELAMQKMRIRETQLNADIEEQSQALKATAKRLQNLNNQLDERQQIAEQRQIELVSLKKDIDRQKQAIEIKEKQLNETVLQLARVKNDLDKQQESVDAKERENIEMENRISFNRQLISKQKLQIDNQGLQLDQKNVELEESSELIELQQFYLMILAVVIFVAILFSILLVWLFVKNKRTTRKLSLTLNNLKEMQDQLVQSEKLASLGKLTAGVAHEINTPLGIALTSTSSALESTRDIKQSFETNALTKSAMTKYFESMDRAANLNMSSLNRVIELLNNFKQVAADQVVGEVREINVASYVNEVMQTLSAEMKRYRVIYTFQGRDDIVINTIPGALAQVLTNLVTNSLKHGFEGLDKGNIDILIEAKNDKVNLVYTDNGIGMDQEVLRNIFEPFFTTKRNSGGTGLGMNIVHNIIRQKLLGNIAIESSQGNGAKFTLSLPLTLS